MIRGIGLRSAVAVNVATMIGAGPLITIPLVVGALHGSISVWAWIAGALIALCDGLCYAELSSLYPRSGGTYAYLREALGPRAGPPAAFLFVWQFVISMPLVLASGYIGFAQYAAFLNPALSAPHVPQLLALGVGILTLASLYRTIPRIAATALVLGAVALATLAAVALCGAVRPAHAPLAAAFGTGGIDVAAFGAALVIVLYDYGGYSGVCALGDEVLAPVRTIPRAIVASLAFVATAYVALNLGVFAVLTPAEVGASTSVASLAVERTAGHAAAVALTLAVLVTAFASTYGGLLGASRIPYAAALEGDFLPAFAALHPEKRFPHVALLALGLLALPPVFFPLDTVIAALTAGIVLVQGVATNLALVAVRRRGIAAPYRLPLYPLPVAVAICAWLFLFWSSGNAAMLFGLLTLAVGAAVYAATRRRRA